MQPLFVNKHNLILASASPRRQLFLQELGVAFSVVQPHGIEPLPEQGEAPHIYAQRAAAVKSHFVAKHHKGSAVIAADTVVALYKADAEQGEIFGKPKDSDHALQMLQALAGREHRVITAVSLMLPWGEEIAFYDSTEVHFHAWPVEILRSYAQCGEPMDKAGAYAIQGQGAFLVDKIVGSWSTVVGLPVTQLVQKMVEFELIG